MEPKLKLGKLQFTTQNTKISPNFLAWKFCENVQFRPKLWGGCAFPKNFRTRNLGDISVIYAMFYTILLIEKYKVAQKQE